MLSRRQALLAGGVAAGILGMPRLLDGAVSAETAHPAHPVAPRGPGVKPVFEAFARPMPTPRELVPRLSTRHFDYYTLSVRPSTAEILPGVRTPVLSYGDGVLGPTIRAKTGRRTFVMVTNKTGSPVNVHLHGGHNAARHDGHPLDLIEPGRPRLYNYANDQQGATLWYHDHTHHGEAEHVYRGMQGLYLIDDESERGLRLPSGDYDVPIVLRDSQFDAAGNLLVGDPADRTTPLANGVPLPYFAVAARKYRFRFVNTANERIFRLSLGTTAMVQVGSDGGLLAAPAPLDTLVIGSAERADVVIDFSAHPVGTQLVLSDEVLGKVLRFDVVREAEDHSRVPEVLRPLPVLPPATVRRTVNLALGFADGRLIGLVDNKMFDPDRVDITTKLGTTEIWSVTSTDPPGVFHTFHLHLVQFRVLDRDGRPPAPHETGWKDTITFAAGETVRVQATFHGHTGRFAYHCHFLDHSGIGMMAQLEITR
ncbi:Multicopper oxidase [Alloactinosynnema sp. L-07]|uniref:multicopper oxidase family protein n=1 Tax=Alloactinosynnema sp. L-07 TaxID=1653480 RepID=UPI00065F0416|nr:multicopper oxidase domain-containing protein [Alloactinosynnema sp. L-07]CRK56725.1 Multicopper oxidase [Alloactinosynnema sp. L-07]